MIYRMLARLSIRYAMPILGAWLIFLIVFGWLAVRLPSVLQDHGLRTDGSYAQVQRTLAKDFHVPSEPVVLLFERKPATAQADFHHFIETALLRLQSLNGLQEIISPLNTPGMEKGEAAYALLSFGELTHAANPDLERLRQLLPHNPQITVALTGKPVVQDEVNRTSRSDLKKAEWIGIPVAFFILWLSFKGLASALIPVIAGLIGVTGTMGIMYKLSSYMELSVFVLNVIPMVGLALSIDFALMIVSRYREELRQRTPDRALAVTLQTSGRAVVFSALCVMLGLAGTLLIRMPMFTSIAAGAMIVLAVSVLLALTLVPAALSLLGGRMQAEMRSRESAGTTSHGTGFWHRLAAFVMKRPIGIAFIASCLISSCLLPLAHMRVAIPDASSLPAASATRQAADRFERLFAPPNGSQAYLIAMSKQAVPVSHIRQDVMRIVHTLQHDPKVAQVNAALSAVTPTTTGPYLISFTLSGEPSSQQTMQWVRDAEQRFSAQTGFRILIGGEAKYQQEVYDEIFYNLKYVLIFIFASNLILLFLAFRSVLIPLKTVLMNVLSLGASFGILAWVFQDGRFGVEPTSIAIMIPVFIFGLTFGISVDYGMFLLSRIAELYRTTRNNDFAVREGLALTSGVITSAAAIMIAVTVPWAFGGVSGVKQLGVGITAAIFIDTTLVRMMLVPSFMKLLGKWNWWSP